MDVVSQFREFVRLDRKHASGGLTPAELERWARLEPNLSRGGLFVATSHLLEIGTRVTLHIHVDSEDERLEVPAEVVSQNVGPGLRPEPQGMGLRFLETDEEVRRKLEALYQGALRRAGARLGSG